MKSNHTLSKITVAAALLLPSLSQADTTKNPLSPWYLQGMQKSWHAEIFTGASVTPNFAGAKDHEIGIGVNPRLIFSDAWDNRYQIGFDGLDATFDITTTFAASVFLAPDGYSLFEDGDQLEGVDDLDESWDAGMRVAQRFGDAYIYAAVRAGNGLSYDVGFGYDMQVTERFAVRPLISVSGADDEKMDNHFGVSASESTASGLDAYEAGAGLRSVDVNVSAEYAFTEHISFFVQGGLEKFVGDALDSPIVNGDDGSEVNLRGFAGLLFRW